MEVKTEQILTREKIRRYKTINLGEVTVPYLFDRALGSYIYDKQGNAKLDFSSGYGVTNTGWTHPAIVAAVMQQLKKATYAPPWLATELALELSEVLLEMAPRGLTTCLRATGGSEAVEGALRAVYALTGKSTLVSFQRSYHGGTAKAIRLSDYAAFNLMDLPRSKHQYLKVPFPGRPESCTNGSGTVQEAASLAAIEEHFKTNPDIAAFIAEPVIGSGGVLVPPDGFLLRIQQLCQRYGVLFILDEVITGFGRLGGFTAAALMDLNPDALLFAKGMGGGYVPIGCALLNEALSNALRQYEDVSPTFGWTPLACAAALANIRVIKEEGLCAKAQVDGEYLLNATRSLLKTYLPDQTREVRGMGMMIGIELVDPLRAEPASRLLQKLLLAFFQEGLMCCADWDSHTLILMPPLTISQVELEIGLGIMEKVVRRFGKEI